MRHQNGRALMLTSVLLVVVGFFLGMAAVSHPVTGPPPVRAIDRDRARGAIILAIVVGLVWMVLQWLGSIA